MEPAAPVVLFNLALLRFVFYLVSFQQEKRKIGVCMGEKMLLARKDHGLARTQEPCHFTVLDSVYPCVGLGMYRVGACTLNEN